MFAGLSLLWLVSSENKPQERLSVTFCEKTETGSEEKVVRIEAKQVLLRASPGERDVYVGGLPEALQVRQPKS
eukprot:scaffold453_cov243-Pinguiococcus_pyrenoidosus.AAC.7